jgi:uncharacterized membrane protein YagU involved in acid resistance
MLLYGTVMKLFEDTLYEREFFGHMGWFFSGGL